MSLKESVWWLVQPTWRRLDKVRHGRTGLDMREASNSRHLPYLPTLPPSFHKRGRVNATSTPLCTHLCLHSSIYTTLDSVRQVRQVVGRKEDCDAQPAAQPRLTTGCASQREHSGIEVQP